MGHRYRLQRKEQYVKPNVLGNHNFPVYTYRWVDIAVSDDLDALSKTFVKELKSKEYRIEDTRKYEESNTSMTNGLISENFLNTPVRGEANDLQTK